jgi:hypothetical protein
MKKHLLLFAAIGVLAINSSAQSWIWAKEGSIGPGAAPYVAVENNGNAYMLVAGGGPVLVFGSDTVNTNNGSGLFIVKYDPNGNVKWIEQPTYANSISSAWAITTDKIGNVLVYGDFSDTIIFGTHVLTAPNSRTPYLVKYDSNGNVMWAIAGKLGLSTLVSQATLAVDASGNIYITGTFSGGYLTFGTHSIIDTNGECYMVKYRPNGSVVWVQQSNSPWPYNMSIDARGDLYTTGWYKNTFTVGSVVLTGAAAVNTFLIKYDSDGNALWARGGIPSNNTNNMSMGYSVTTDNAMNSYVTGPYSDHVTFGTNSFFSPTQDIFILKYDSSGDLIWARSSTHSDTITWTPGVPGISADTLGHFYLVGSAGRAQNSDITFGSVTLKLTNSAWTEFIMKFDTSGNSLCGSMFRIYGFDGLAVGNDPEGENIYMTTDMYDTTTFGTDLVGFAGEQLPVIAKWQPCTLRTEGINEITSQKYSISLFPNPNNGQFTIEVKSEEPEVKGKVEIYNVLGEKVYSQFSSVTADESQLSINIGNQPSGVYLFKIIDETDNVLKAGKFVIQN